MTFFVGATIYTHSTGQADGTDKLSPSQVGFGILDIVIATCITAFALTIIINNSAILGVDVKAAYYLLIAPGAMALIDLGTLAIDKSRKASLIMQATQLMQQAQQTAIQQGVQQGLQQAVQVELQRVQLQNNPAGQQAMQQVAQQPVQQPNQQQVADQQTIANLKTEMENKLKAKDQQHEAVLTQYMNKAADLNLQVQNLTGQVNGFKGTREQLESQIDQLVERLRKAEAEIKQKEESLAQQNSNLSASQTASQQQVAAAEAKQKELETALSELRQQLSQTQEELRKAMLQIHEQQTIVSSAQQTQQGFKDLQNQYQTLLQDLGELQLKRSAGSAAPSQAQLQEKIKALQDLTGDLQQKLQTQQTLADGKEKELDELKKQLQAKTPDSASPRRRDSDPEHPSSSSSTTQSLISQLNELKQKLADTEEKLAAKEKENNRLSEQTTGSNNLSPSILTQPQPASNIPTPPPPPPGMLSAPPPPPPPPPAPRIKPATTFSNKPSNGTHTTEKEKNAQQSNGTDLLSSLAEKLERRKKEKEIKECISKLGLDEAIASLTPIINATEQSDGMLVKQRGYLLDFMKQMKDVLRRKQESGIQFGFATMSGIDLSLGNLPKQWGDFIHKLIGFVNEVKGHEFQMRAIVSEKIIIDEVLSKLEIKKEENGSSKKEQNKKPQTQIDLQAVLAMALAKRRKDIKQEELQASTNIKQEQLQASTNWTDND